MSDAEYDKLARAIRPRLATGHPRLDRFFREHFDPSTGLWVHKHPHKDKLEALYYRHYYPVLYQREIKRAQRRRRRRAR